MKILLPLFLSLIFLCPQASAQEFLNEQVEHVKLLAFVTKRQRVVAEQAKKLNEQVEAKAVVKTRGEFFDITAIALNKTAFSKSLRYELSTFKNAQPGQSGAKSTSEGFFVLEPQEQKILSRQSLNAEEGQRVIVLLLLYEDEKIVGKDRVLINGLEGEEDLAPLIVENMGDRSENQNPDVAMLRGLVLENTKTKPGRDFYKMFYSLYTANNINAEKIVHVEEELAIGGNTQIRIRVEDDVIAQFIVNPRSDYLQQLAESCIARVRQHFARLQRYENQQVRY